MAATENRHDANTEIDRSFFNRDFWIKLSFIAVSALLWFLTKLSQDDYTDKLNYSFEVLAPKSGMVITDFSVDEFVITVEANGYDLLSEKTALNNSLILNLDEADKIDDNTFVWDTRKNMDLLSRQLPSKFKIKQVSPKSVVIKIDNLVQIKAKVQVDFSIDLELPYRLYGEVKVKPKEVKLWVPASVKDSVIILRTEHFSISDIESKQKLNLPLVGINAPFTAEPSVVEINFEVRAFTQKSLEVPIVVKNVPVNGQVRLFPEKVNVTINISQGDYESVTAKDFACVADFNLMNADQNRVSLSLTKIPGHIELIDWGEKSVEFIIIDK